MSGSIEGHLLSILAGVPFLRVQTILQTQDMIPTLKFNPAKGAIDCVKRIKREEGLRFLWRSGVPTALLLYGRTAFSLFSALFYYSLKIGPLEEEIEELKEKETPEKTEQFSEEAKQDLDAKENNEIIIKTETLEVPLSHLSIMLFVQNLFFHPLEVLKVRMASDFTGKDGRRYKGMFDAGRKLVKSEGIKSLYRGFIPRLLHTIIYTDVFNVILGSSSDENPLFSLLRETILFPFVVISSRMMMWPDNPLGKYRNIRECIKGTYKDLGFKGFYKGFQVALLFQGLIILSGLIPDIDEDEDEDESV